MHKPPASVSMIGRTEQANHQHDTADFFAAAKAAHLPAVSCLKAPAAVKASRQRRRLH